MSIGKICVRDVYLVSPNESVSAAAQRMADNGVGCLVTVSESRRPIGILTDRDITVRVIAKGLDPQVIRIEEMMTRNPRVSGENTPIEEAVALMRNAGVRRLPVVNGSGQLVGLVCLDDILELLLGEFGDVSRILQSQTPFQRRAAHY